MTAATAKASKPSNKRTKTAPQTKAGKKPKITAHERDDEDEELEEEDDEDDAEDEDGAEQDQDEELEDVTPVVVAKKGAGGKKPASGAGAVSGELDDGKDSSSASAREKKLQKKLELTTTALKNVEVAFEQLRELRTTRAEESEKALVDIASERQTVALTTIQNYKSENDALRSEIADLRHSLSSHSTHTTSASFSSSSSARSNPLPSSEMATKLAKLEKLNEDLAKENKELKDAKERKESEERRKIAERDQKWEKELARTVKAKDEEAAKHLREVKSQLDTVTRDLAAEIQLSKSVQAKTKNGAAASVTASSSTSLASIKTQEELADIKSRFELLEDLTSLSVLSVKRDEDGSTYNCLLHGCSDKVDNESLSFKLTFHPDGYVTYVPTVDQERDNGLWKILAADQRTRIKFNALQSASFFRRLFVSMNKLKKSSEKE